jgi:spore coat protein U-like protein
MTRKEEAKMRKLIVIVIAIAIIAMAGVAMATDTASVSVSATVSGNCKFLTGGTMAFGTLTPAVSTPDVDATVTQPTFWCTKNASYTISDDYGLHEVGTQRKVIGATHSELINYSMIYAGGTGQGRDTTLTMNISGTILGNDYKNTSADTYSDTVTLTITP